MLDNIGLSVFLYRLAVPRKRAGGPVCIPRHLDLKPAATARPEVQGEVVAIERGRLAVLGNAQELMLRVCALLDRKMSLWTQRADVPRAAISTCGSNSRNCASSVRSASVTI